MSKVIFSNCDISLDEYNAHMLINPVGERFYCIPCENQTNVFRDATLTLNDDDRYVIEGTHLIFTKHRGIGFNYKELLCLHPEELIRKHSFLGLLTWYKVSGTLKREVRAKYLCKHKAYTIDERLEFLSHTCIQEV